MGASDPRRPLGLWASRFQGPGEPTNCKLHKSPVGVRAPPNVSSSQSSNPELAKSTARRTLSGVLSRLFAESLLLELLLMGGFL